MKQEYMIRRKENAMKRAGALLLAILLLLMQPAAWADGTAIENSLTVGNPTPMRGDFFTEFWGNATSDMDVRDLLHAYDLVCWDAENCMFTVDPSVVSGMAVTENEAGDRTYTMALYHDLYWSDGTPITARDYAFSYLFSLAPEVDELRESNPHRGEQFVGYQAYADKEVPWLAGVRVIADDMLSVTLDHEVLPFFYELGLLSCKPWPISVIAPGVEVRDDGNGVYLANKDASVTEPVFTTELLKKTVLDKENGYLSHPSLVSGPYTLTSWDGVTAEFALNPYYKGNAAGRRADILKLTYTLATNDTMIEKLAAGEFGLLNKVTRADRIAAGLSQPAEKNLAVSSYPRIGLSFISFACEQPTVSSEAVRQAIAWCFDRDAVTRDYTGEYGLRVDGYYGVGQWMFGLATGSRKYPTVPAENGENKAQTAEAAELSLSGLNPYGVDTGKAAALLDADGWVLNAGGLREKDGVVLDLKLSYPEGNSVFESLQKNLADHLAEVGIRLSMSALPMEELLSRWYCESERTEDMFFLASNFEIVFDPSSGFTENEKGEHLWRNTSLQDEELYRAAVSMRSTRPGDVTGYMRSWIAFQERFNTVLPMIPVYSNMYYDFYTEMLRCYAPDANESWGKAIVGAYLG